MSTEKKYQTLMNIKNGKFVIRWLNQKLKHIKRRNNNCHIPGLIRAFSYVENRFLCILGCQIFGFERSWWSQGFGSTKCVSIFQRSKEKGNKIQRGIIFNHFRGLKKKDSIKKPTVKVNRSVVWISCFVWKKKWEITTFVCEKIDQVKYRKYWSEALSISTLTTYWNKISNKTL